MTDQDPFARAGQPGEPAHSAGPAPRDGSASAGVRYESHQHDATGQATPSNPWRAPTANDNPAGTATMPRTEQPTEQTGSPWATPTGWGQHGAAQPPSGPPPTSHWPTGGSGGGGGRRRRSPLVLVAAGLAALLVAGGVGGVVGYEAASAGSGGNSSVLSGSSDSSSSSSSPAPAGSVEAVAQKVLPSVVQLRGPSGEGSGIVISADGLILTNAHVLEAGQQQTQQQGGLGGLGGLLGGGQQQQQQPSTAGTQLQAVFQNGQTASVQVVGTDATADLAVVRAQGVSNLTPVALGDSGQLQVGQEVVAVGSPLGLSGTVTSGIVSALQRPVATGGAQSGQATVIDAVQTDAAINPGNSGGALVDMNGRVIGITSAIASLGSSSGGEGGGQQSGSIGLGFAIPINQAKRIGDQLAQQGFANQAVLGVGVAQDQQQGSTTENGATIGSVSPGGAAANAGLKAGDVVTKVDDRLIDDGDSLIAAVRAENPGAQVTLTVQSQGQQPRQVPVTLGTERAPSS
ncbi:S1C family serine protease [Actinomycetospora sp. TBRC 11914]|uniref:S1C family serine protease n=1 Tax=Actinomycetospora sp. TBRC 11914 TaxID=2729387 RepID=UPI00145C72A5|nr:trypsin-like peptidase domain-containing protein [Actinomycetospora sp. TBRC 11914]NMO89264.1 PDZ domain-containing protein [Actinomycetospora sp. TBRC 11914]